MLCNSRVLIHEGVNPYHNLAVETYLLQTCPQDTAILYLWQNQNTVVIGRNQNAYKECKIDVIEKNKGFLARRISGGGAVYHDLGNLNFTLILPNKEYSLKKQFELLIEALSTCGIYAKISGRNDLLVEDKKFSGNAFYHGIENSYHHGTLLYDVDFTKMTDHLNVSAKKLTGNGVQSVISRVVNLKEIKPNLSLEELKQACISAFLKFYPYNYQMIRVEDLNQIAIQSLQKKYESDAWLFNHHFIPEINLHEKFTWGEFQMIFKIDHDCILDCALFADAMDSEAFVGIASECIGLPFKTTEIFKVLKNHIKDQVILYDLEILMNKFIKENL